jgi:hypothetical protein
MLRPLFAIISLMIGTVLLGQDTTYYQPKVISPYIYWDYGKTATLWTHFENKTELGAGIVLFEKLDLAGEYGLATLNPQNAFENIDYSVQGTYLRLGLGYLASLDPKNKIGFEVRYAQSKFEDAGDLVYGTNSGFNSNYERSFNRDELEANWTEVNLVSQRFLTLLKKSAEHRANRLLSIGIKIRYRMLNSASKAESLPPIYAIPGYGRADTNSIVAVNIFLKASL